MEFRLYCELKVNDRKTGKLLEYVGAIYVVDEEDIKEILATGDFDAFEDRIERFMLDEIETRYPKDSIITDLDILYLDDDPDEDDDEEDED